MKNIMMMVAGLIILIFVVICPFPPALAVPGVVWRILFGLLSGFLLVSGIYKTARKR